MTCAHQGPELATLGCRTCKGNVRLKVFSCDRHGCCTAEKALWPVEPGRYQVCAGCSDKAETNGHVNLVRRHYDPMPNEWRKWIVDNLLLGGEPVQLIQILASHFSHEVAVVEVAAAIDHPYVAAGLGIATTLRKRDWLLSTYAKLSATTPKQGIERIAMPSPDDFFDRYYSTNRPVVITGAFDDWPALTKWTPEYFRERHGDKQVEVQAGRSNDPNFEINSHRLKVRIPFAEYLDKITSAGGNDLYMTANNSGANAAVFSDLWQDAAPLPPYLDASKTGQQFLWLGPAGTVTPLHHDMTNNFMAQVRGRKLCKLISPNFTPQIYNHTHVYSQVDLDAVDYAKFPLMRGVRVEEVEIGPGDLLFVPIGYWHHVRSLDLSITVTFTSFTQPNQF